MTKLHRHLAESPDAVTPTPQTGHPGKGNRAVQRYADRAVQRRAGRGAPGGWCLTATEPDRRGAPPARRETDQVLLDTWSVENAAGGDASRGLATRLALDTSHPGSADTVHQAATRGIQSGGGSLPHLDQIQFSFGNHDLSGVSAHVGGATAEACDSMGAEAYATGNSVAFRSQPSLHTAAHEAAHIVQQRAGVSLPSGVGSVGDAYERNADAVADRVVAGKSAADLLPSAGASAGGAVQRKAVQLRTEPDADVKARGESTGAKFQAFETLADAAANDGVTNKFKRVQTGVGVNNGASMALDPQFEGWAKQFETRFGAFAESHAAANAAATAMCDRIIDIILAHHNVFLQHYQTQLTAQSPEVKNLVGEACGLTPSGKSAGVAGAVTPKNALAHMRGANLRTKMTTIFNFTRPFQARLEELSERGKKDDFLRMLGGNTATLDQRMDHLEQNPGSKLIEESTTGPVGGQASTRGAFHNQKAAQSIRTPGQVGATRDEKQFMNGDRATWVEGARKWWINENDAWVRDIRNLSMPLKAGPSGTTDRMMQMGALLGVTTPEQTRAACLAYLLPINAHSLVEIMVAAREQGAACPRGIRMYHTIAPFGQLGALSPDPNFWIAVCHALNRNDGD